MTLVEGAILAESVAVVGGLLIGAFRYWRWNRGRRPQHWNDEDL